MHPKLEIGSGLRRAKKNRSRGPRPVTVRTIYFEDRGQDFLWWTIASNGMVVDCGPFQATTWCKCVVLGAKRLTVGEHPQIITPHNARPITLNYAVTKIEPGAYPHPGTEGVSPAKFLKLLRAPRCVKGGRS